MSLETLNLEHLPSDHKIHLAFFRNIQNAAFLHEQLLARNTDFEYAFVDASVVVSRNQLLSAVYKAITLALNDSLKTPNVHSETVASLTASNNISEAYRRYGISPSTKNLLIVKITFPTTHQPEPATAESIWSHLQANVQGDPTPFTDDSLVGVTDLAKLKKYYKLNGVTWLEGMKDETAKRKEVEKLVLGAMALRGI